MSVIAAQIALLCSGTLFTGVNLLMVDFFVKLLSARIDFKQGERVEKTGVKRVLKEKELEEELTKR